MVESLPKIVVVIPAYNEAESIGDVVRQASLRANGVLVVDDGSTDDTIFVALQSGAKVFRQPHQGVGAATRRAWQGIKWDEYYNVMVTLDGDGQHYPTEIPIVAAPIINGEADLVIGSRFINEHPDYANQRRYRRFGIAVITWLYNVGNKQKITDAQSCFRAFSRDSLDKIAITENGFGFSTEILLKARKAGLRIAEVPISCIYHKEYSRNSTLNPIRHGLEVVWATLKWRLKLRT